MLLAEMKDFNELINDEPVFQELVKASKKRMKNLLKCPEIMTIQQET